MHKLGHCAEKPAFGGGQVHNLMRQSMLLNDAELISIERRTTRLEYGFVGTDIASNGDAETSTHHDTESVEAVTAAATDASATATETQ